MPRSGIALLADRMPLPSRLGTEDSAADVTICFAAEIAARKLLTRIQNSLYMTDASAMDARQLHVVVAELDHQLARWHSTIPEHLRPLLGSTIACSCSCQACNNGETDTPTHAAPGGVPATLRERVDVLRVHYYAARALIHRPFLLRLIAQQLQAAAHGEHAELPPPTPPSAVALEQCAICADACTALLCCLLPLLDRPSLYLWTWGQSSMACLLTLLLSDACLANTGSRVVPCQGQANGGSSGLDGGSRYSVCQLRDAVAGKLRWWAQPGSSFEAMLRIVESLPVPPQ